MSEPLNIYQRLTDIQSRLKAPKNQHNNFGGYWYRSAEDILEALKPLLHEHGLMLTISDEIVEVGSRIYVKATARIAADVPMPPVEATAYAREPENRKGSDESQITGSASSYARKYALNGLFLIDDTKDADATNTHDAPGKPQQARGASNVSNMGQRTRTQQNRTQESNERSQSTSNGHQTAMKSLHAWGNEHAVTHEQLRYAAIELQKGAPIASLKDLSTQQLTKLRGTLDSAYKRNQAEFEGWMVYLEDKYSNGVKPDDLAADAITF